MYFCVNVLAQEGFVLQDLHPHLCETHARVDAGSADFPGDHLGLVSRVTANAKLTARRRYV